MAGRASGNAVVTARRRGGERREGREGRGGRERRNEGKRREGETEGKTRRNVARGIEIPVTRRIEIPVAMTGRRAGIRNTRSTENDLMHHPTQILSNFEQAASDW